MNSSFFEKSRQIADNFLQTVVLIDDQAYSRGEGDDQHDLNAVAVTRNFAKNRKLCSVYQPEKETGLEYLAKVAKKADIVILDWKIHLESEGDTQVNEEEVIANEDPRGEYTLRIIDGILSDPEPGVSGLKLILIYTGETNLSAIAEAVHARLKNAHNTVFVLGLFEVISANVKVVVIGKPTLQVTHVPEIKGRVIDYPALPDFILNEFTQMTSGLISDFVLNALCILRSNTSRLLQLFNRSLDPALLAHCALLPDYEDAQEQLIEMLAHSVSALLNYNKAGESLSIERIESWIDAEQIDKHIENLSIKLNDNDAVLLNKDFLKNWIRNNFEKTCRPLLKDLNSTKNLKELREDVRVAEKTVHKEATKFFTSEVDFEKKDRDFSVLTHQKSNLKQPSQIPKLSLGSIIKKEDVENSRYYVCIQQKCDSVRVNEPRQYLFLPLSSVTLKGNFHFIADEGATCSYLKVNFKTFHLRTIIFGPSEGSNVVKATRDTANGAFYFQSASEGRFLWLSDLKDGHAQRLANEFAAKLSRVGLDESEWLRRWGTNASD